MSAEIIEANRPFSTTADIPAATVLSGAQDANLTECIVYGYDETGEPYFASTTGDLAKTAYILNRALHKVMQMADDNET